MVALGLLGYFVTNLVVEESEEKDCLLGRTSQRIGDPIVINPGQYDQIVGGRVYTVTHQHKLVKWNRHFREVRDYPVNLECHAVFDKLMESVRVEVD